MTYEQALAIVKQPDRIGCNLIKANDEESNKYNQESIEALNMVRKALEIVIDFEKAQIITGGRLNGRTYAYKCGLEDGKRKALEQQAGENTVTITMNKGTLKYSGQGYVVYNKNWFRKHFATEVAIMTGYDGYKGQPTIEEILSHITTGITATGQSDSYCVGFCNALVWLKSCITHEEPQFFKDEHKVGKWLKSEIGGAKVCSICQSHMGLSNFKYCPNCGADMKGNKDGI